MSVAVVVLFVIFTAFYAWAAITPLKHSEARMAGSPGLTIREHFKRTNALFVRIVVPVAGAWVGAIMLFGTGMTKAHQQALSVGAALLVL